MSRFDLRRRGVALGVMTVMAVMAMTACESDGPTIDGGSSGDTPTTPTSSRASAAATSIPRLTPSPTKAPIGTGAPTDPTATVFPEGDIDHGLDPYVRRATADLAGRLGIDESAIEVVSAVLVVWPDTSLGCPDPDKAYVPAVADGSVIELRADGRIYRYHSGEDVLPFLCDVALRRTPSRSN